MLIITGGKEDINDNKTLATPDNVEYNHDKSVKNHNPDIRLNMNGPEETHQLLNNDNDETDGNFKKGSQQNINFETGL